MKVKKFEIKIHNAKSGIPIVQIDASIPSPRSKKKKGGKKNRKYRTFESLRVILHRETEREKERMNQSCVDRGKFTWPVVLVGPRCIRLRVLLGKLDYNGTDIVFNDIRNKSSTCIIVGDTQMRATTMEMELAGSSVHVKIYNKRVSTRATLINTLGHRERSFACRGCIVRVSGTILDTVYIYLNFYSPVKIFVRYTLDRKNLRTRKF